MEYEQDRGNRSDGGGLYSIMNDDEYGIIVGLLDGQQTMIHFDQFGYLTLTFSADGELLSVRHEPHRQDEDKNGAQGDVIRRMVRGKPIRVRRFFLPDRHLGIQELPTSLHEVRVDPSRFGESERRSLLHDLQIWQRTGQFVLQWDNEYYLSADGHVVGS